MGSADRDYFRDEEARYAGGGRPPLPPVTKALLIANVVIFLIDLFTRPGKQGLADFGLINEQLAFTVQSAFREFRIWELVTFQFLHGGILPLVFNSIALFVFGSWVERWWGTKRFIAFYLLCGVAGALFFTVLALVFRGLELPLVDSSAGVYGLIVATAVIAPNAMISLLLPPVTLTVRKFAFWMIGIAAVMVLFNSLGGRSDTAAQLGLLLGGVSTGWLLMRYPQLLRKDSASSKIIRPREFKTRKPKREAKLRPRSQVKSDASSEVDRILDKINREGVQSLSDQEREILQQASKSNDKR